MRNDPRARLIPLLLAVFAFALAFGATAPGPADAGLPCVIAERSGFGVSAPFAGCQYRFNAGGTLDELAVVVTLRDCFDVPVAGCEISATVGPNAGTEALCGCEPLRQVAVTDPSGICEYVFSRLGGRGSLDIRLTAHCAGDIWLYQDELPFTTPDLDGSCEPAPLSSTGVVDLGLWAWGYSVYLPHSDFDCDGSVGIIDLGTWASGLGSGCP